MRRHLSLLGLVLVPLLPTTAQAAVVHTVAPGETLWQLAAMNNMTTRSFAAANGLSPDAQIVSGTAIKIPSVAAASAGRRRRALPPPGPRRPPWRRPEHLSRWAATRFARAIRSRRSP